MINKKLLFGFFLIFCRPLFAQDFSRQAKDAFMVTRMAVKFHLNPPPLNDTFSTHVFSGVLNQLDGDKIYFTIEDITILGKYQAQLDDEIKEKKADFLKMLAKIFLQRLQAVDSLVADINKKPFDFSLNEEINVAEMDAYPSNAMAARINLYKMMKADALLPDIGK